MWTPGIGPLDATAPCGRSTGEPWWESENIAATFDRTTRSRRPVTGDQRIVEDRSEATPALRQGSIASTPSWEARDEFDTGDPRAGLAGTPRPPRRAVAGGRELGRRPRAGGGGGEGLGRDAGARVRCCGAGSRADRALRCVPRARRQYPWAELMRRVFAVDVLECPRCHGPMRILAAIYPPDTAGAILECLGLPARNATPGSAAPDCGDAVRARPRLVERLKRGLAPGGMCPGAASLAAEGRARLAWAAPAWFRRTAPPADARAAACQTPPSPPVLP